ncbi:MAG TPA: CYCXC family (seleno)protein [Candidatus Acidoferrales bacterium]
MNSFRRSIILAIAFGAALASIGSGTARAQSTATAPPPAAQAAPATTADSKIPAYHAAPPAGPLPETIDPKLFADPETQNIYALAAKEKAVLYQQPCYCRCDKEVGHKSLLDCYVDYHAAHCILCKKEAAFAYSETQAGKTAEAIRKEIMDGKWKTVKLEDYDTVLPAK